MLPEKNGRALDADGAAARVARAALDASVVEIELPFADVAPRVTRASLARIDISQVVASFKTYFSRYGDQGPRARNIEVAASHVDGLVMEPGQPVSFNDVVGPRTEDNGFKTAFEIVKGEYKEGTGGGTCQVASTLHAIAFYGGLDIVQRLPHSRPSGYIPSGLDATVVYPVVDLKVRNPFTFPVVVHATVGANILKMELLGADKPIEVTFGKQVLSTTPYERKVEEDPTVSKPKRKQKGIDGLELFRQRVLAYRDGTRKVENARDVYPPTKEVWQVPPGFDESTLPGLGEDLPKPDAKPQAEAQGRRPRGDAGVRNLTTSALRATVRDGDVTRAACRRGGRLRAGPRHDDGTGRATADPRPRASRRLPSGGTRATRGRGAPSRADRPPRNVAGAESPELPALRAAERELFPPAMPHPGTPWPTDLPSPPGRRASARPTRPAFPRARADRAPAAEGARKDLSWLVASSSCPTCRCAGTRASSATSSSSRTIRAGTPRSRTCTGTRGDGGTMMRRPCASKRCRRTSSGSR